MVFYFEIDAEDLVLLRGSQLRTHDNGQTTIWSAITVDYVVGFLE